MTLDQVTLDDFRRCLGEQFQVVCGGQTTTAELTSVNGLGFHSLSGPGEKRSDRESFSLLFHAPKPWRHPQGIYRMSNAALGELEIFVVPIGPDEKGMRLEAIFNFT